MPYLFVTAVPLVALFRVLSGGSLLVGDRAVFALQVSDVVHGHFPAVGQYSWHGWNHPGPIAFYLFAPFHWVMAGASAAMFVGAAVWNAVFAGLAVRTANRRNQWGGYAVAIVMGATWFAASRLCAADPWTPYLALPVLVWFMAGVWGTIERDRSAVWALFLSAAILVQVHVGYVPITVAVGVTAVVMYWRGGGAVTQIARPLTGAVVLFVPLLFHPVTAARNVADLVRYFVTNEETSIGLMRGLRVFAREMSPNASWFGGVREEGVIGEAPVASVWWFVLLAVVLVTTAISARRHPRIKATIPSVVVLFIITAVAVVQVRGYVFAYVVLFRAPIVVVIVVWCVVALATRFTIPGKVVVLLTTAIIAVTFVAQVITVLRHDTVTSDAEAIHTVVTTARRNVIDEPVLLRLGDGGLVGLYPELVRSFEEDGVRSGIAVGTEWVFGARAIDADAAAEVWYVCDTGVAFSLLSMQPGARVVAQQTPFRGELEAEVVSIQSQLARQLRAAGRSSELAALDSPLVAFAFADSSLDQDMVTELGVLNSQTPEPGFRFGIVAFPLESPPDIWWSLDSISAI